MNMKKIFILSAVLALFSACANKDEWKLVWSDEFDGEQIDEATWTRVPTGKDDWDDMMSLREDLAYVENGELVLMGKVNDGTAPDNGRPFVTAGIIS
jgi:beta-glucanase (GH16 family)